MRATETGEEGSFGELLRRHRLAVGLTQEELAEQAGLSARGIADLERGARTRPYPATLQRLVQALGLPEAAITALHAARRASGSASEKPAPPPALAASVPRSLIASPGRSSVFIGRNAELAVLESRTSASSDAAGKSTGWVQAPFLTSDAPSRLLERLDQTTALNEHLSVVVSSSRGRLVFIGGEAGVGKTALIRHLCAEHARSVQILSGSCDALFTPRPLGPILDIAQVTGGELEELLERGSRPYEIAAALMRGLRSSAPTILILEDVHWADEATLDVLRLVARRIETIPALVVASYRDDELDRMHPLRVLLGELPAGQAITRMRLGPLSLAAVAELAEPFDIDAADLYRKTAGNAFFVTEALAAGDVRIPPTVRDAVLARAARLRPGAIALLEAVAVVPPLAELWLLERLAPDALEFVEECLASGMLTPATGGIAFRHELARLAIEESLTPLRRLALHRRALQVLASPPAGTPDLARLAHHAEAAADSEAVQRFAPAAAARAALLGAHREAAAQYTRALQFADGLPPARRAELLERHLAPWRGCTRLWSRLPQTEAIAAQAATGARQASAAATCSRSP